MVPRMRPSSEGQRAARQKLGALAQLGERLICIQEVIGSIPIGSTSILSGLTVEHFAKCFTVQPDEMAKSPARMTACEIDIV